MRNQLLTTFLALLLSSASTGLFAAESAGQADLDKAFEARLTAQSLDALEKIVDLCRSAIKKGLDDENRKFAEQLLASSLFQRGEVLARGVLEATRPDPQLPQIRVEALSDLQEALKLDDDLPQAHVLVARLLLLPGGDVKKARSELDAALKSTKIAPEVRAEALLTRSLLREKPEDRLADLDEAIRADGSSAQAYRLRAALKLAMNKPEDSVADFDAALKIDPKHAATHEARGLALAAQKKWDEAKASLSKAAELFPQAAGALLQRGRINMLAGDHRAAAADADAVLKLVPEQPDALLLRSHAKFAGGDKEGALEDVNQVLDQVPNAPQGLRTRIAINLELHNPKDAIDDLERLAKIEPEQTDILLQLAALENSLKQNDRAVELLDGVLKKEPKNWRAMRIRADAQLGRGKHREAMQDYEAALALEPKDDGLLNNLAWLLATSPNDGVRDGKRSIELAEAACRVTEYKAPHILSTLAAAYAESGDFDAARKWSKKAVEIAADAEKETLRKELESYEANKPWREALNESAEVPTTNRK
jgi:tetratricopeptide (TPR) repeat protein